MRTMSGSKGSLPVCETHWVTDEDKVEPILPRDRVPLRKRMLDRRREKIRAEIERNRRGEYTVPTWVLVAALVALVAGLAAFIIWG